MKRSQTTRGRTEAKDHRTAARPSRRRSSRTEDRLKSILHATTDFYGTWNLSQGPLHLGDLCAESLGYTAETPNNVVLQSLIHPEELAFFQAQLKAHLSGKTSAFDCEFRLRTKAGTYRWFDIRGKTIRSDRRGAAAEIAYAMRDIHSRKQQRDEAVASHERLMAIFQASSDCMSIVDPVEFRLIAFNRSFEELIFKAYGIRVSPGMRGEEISPEHAKEWGALYRRAISEGAVSREYFVPSLNLTHQVSVQCLVRNRRVFGIGVIGHDITKDKQVENALRKSEETFSKAFRIGPSALSLTSTRDHRYIEVNDAFLHATGYSREELIGKTAHEVGIWGQPEQQIEMVRQVLRAGEVRNLEILIRCKSGEIRELLGSAVLIDIDCEPCMLAVAIDITDQQRTAEALRENEERLRAAIGAGRVYAFEWDPATDTIERSGQDAGWLDLPEAGSRPTRKELIKRVHPEDRQNYIGAPQSLTPDLPDYRVVFRLSLRDGRTAWLEECGRAIFGPDKQLRKVLGITTDVTEVRQSERALRELSRRLISSQEEERRRIARELHDHIGQEAALLCVQAQRIDSGAADEEHTTRSDIHELYRRIQVLSTDISKLSHRLHSSELSFLGLAVAAERLCRDFASQYGIDVDYQAKSAPPVLDSAKSLCLYRVLQEALQNVAKHSHASRVTVNLHAVENQLVLDVTDNGCGFENGETTVLNSGLGVLSMRERLNLVAGRLEISSRRGSGTRVSASVMI